MRSLIGAACVSHLQGVVVLERAKIFVWTDAGARSPVRRAPTGGGGRKMTGDKGADATSETDAVYCSFASSIFRRGIEIKIAMFAYTTRRRNGLCAFKLFVAFFDGIVNL